MGREQFVGSWRMVTTEYRGENGEVVYPMGEKVMGQLMYDANGYMSVQHMNANRSPFALGDFRRGTPDEVKSAFEGYRAYYGTYDVDEEKGTVTHHVEAGSFPNWSGTDNVRFYQFNGNRLILKSTPLLMGGKYYAACLIWERLK